MRSVLEQSLVPVASRADAYGLTKQTEASVRHRDVHRLDSCTFSKKLNIIVFIFIAFNFSYSQEPLKVDTLNLHKPDQKRTWLVTGINVVGYGGSLIVLNSAWYKNYPHTSFHTFNDAKEWLQVDKVGHAWTAYNTGRVSAAMWQWAGLPEKRSALIGGLSGAAYLTVIELMDAHSSKWGWSWSDVAANIFGSGFFISQELLWKEQRIQYKFSFHPKDYGEPILNQRADDLFGKSWYERMLKDYNAQTYWLSVNLKSFFSQTNLPGWLNVSVGYGADGMFGGFENKWTDGDPGFPINRTDIPRKRQFYLAPDIDFTKIKTNKKWLRTILFCLNAFKCPAPALMIDSKGKFKAYALYF
jgi:hypothetical protein